MSVLASMKARLRQFKPAWAAYNMLHYRKLSRNADLYRRFGIRRSVVGPIAHRDITRPLTRFPGSTVRTPALPWRHTRSSTAFRPRSGKA